MNKQTQTNEDRRVVKNRVRAQIEQHLPLVQKMARQIASRTPANIRAEDLIGAGTLGLMDSVTRNRGGDGPAFACYMRTRIRGAIQDELRAFDWLPRRARKAGEKSPNSSSRRPVAVVGFGDLQPGPERQPACERPESDPLEATTNKALGEALRVALSSLGEREQLVLKLHYFNDMRLKEIGRLLSVSEARISQIHHRALGKLRPILKNAA